MAKIHAVFNLCHMEREKEGNAKGMLFANVNISLYCIYWHKYAKLTKLAAKVDAVCVDAFEPPVSFRK